MLSFTLFTHHSTIKSFHTHHNAIFYTLYSSFYYRIISPYSRTKKRYAIGAACIGGGQGMAIVLKNAHL